VACLGEGIVGRCAHQAFGETQTEDRAELTMKGGKEKFGAFSAKRGNGWGLAFAKWRQRSGRARPISRRWSGMSFLRRRIDELPKHSLFVVFEIPGQSRRRGDRSATPVAGLAACDRETPRSGRRKPSCVASVEYIGSVLGDLYRACQRGRRGGKAGYSMCHFIGPQSNLNRHCETTPKSYRRRNWAMSALR
jgi:hypothetical protein